MMKHCKITTVFKINRLRERYYWDTNENPTKIRRKSKIVQPQLQACLGVPLGLDATEVIIIFILFNTHRENTNSMA